MVLETIYREFRLQFRELKPFIYLVQGQKKLVKSLFEPNKYDSRDVIFLTYDEPMENAIFYPQSTWAQGRNKLLSAALKKGTYRYYIFCDDDIFFKKGSWKLFEENLLKYQPALGVPVFPRTTYNVLKFPKLDYQSFFINDEQLIAFHKDVVKDTIVLPYQNKFDAISWSTSCEIQQILIQNFYHYGSIQFNNIQVANTCKERYSQQHQDDKSYRKVANKWIAEQFKTKYRRTSYYRPPRLHQILYRTLLFRIKIFLGKTNYSVNQKLIKNKLYPDSDLAVQFYEPSVV